MVDRQAIALCKLRPANLDWNGFIRDFRVEYVESLMYKRA